ncbi:MAG: cupredoxin domain-containing protein [Candidatus Spechtbacterales bacterium]
MKNRAWALMALIAVVAIIATACGNGNLQPPEPSQPNQGQKVVKMTMTDFAFDPAIVNVSENETVKFVITNNGVVKHEFRIASMHEIEEHMGSGHGDHNGADNDANVLVLEPGETGEITYTFKGGEKLIFACLLPGHYEAGMKGSFDGIGHDDHGKDKDGN